MRGLNPRPARKLSRAAVAFRTAHAAIAIEQLLAIAYVWWCALSGRRDRLLRIAAASLIGEGVLVAANHGDCPLGGLQERLGDPVPLFELVLSARRKAGCADAGRHHCCRASPTGSTRSKRRPLGGEVDEMALRGASGITGALRGFVSRPTGQWGSEAVRRAVEVGLALVNRGRWALGPEPGLWRIPDRWRLARRGRNTFVYPRCAGSDGVVGSIWLVEGASCGRSCPLAPPHGGLLRSHETAADGP